MTTEKHRARFSRRLARVAELLLWLACLFVVVRFGWSHARADYWIDLTPRAVLACNQHVGDLLIDRVTPPGLVLPDGPSGGTVLLAGVSDYAVAGTAVVGIASDPDHAGVRWWFVTQTEPTR